MSSHYETGFSTPSIIELPLQPYTGHEAHVRYCDDMNLITVWWHTSVTPIPKCSQLDFTKCTYKKRGHQVCTPLVMLTLNWGEARDSLVVQCECLYVFKQWALFRNTWREVEWVMYHCLTQYMLTSESWGILLPQLYPLHTLALLHWAEFKPIRCASFSGSLPALCRILYTKQGWSLEDLIMYGFMRGFG